MSEERIRELIKFAGKERDAEDGLDYFGARYFSSSMGRWTTADWSSTPVAVPFASFQNPQSLNLYLYGLNNPTTVLDADGHQAREPVRTPEEEAREEREFEEELRKVEERNRELRALRPLAPGEQVQTAETKAGWDDPTTGVCHTDEPTKEDVDRILKSDPPGLTFDQARLEAFKKSGLTNPNDVKFTRVDPETGTVVEFRGSGGREVSYDKSHPETPGPAHDSACWLAVRREMWKRSATREYSYTGPQHPSRSKDAGAVTPH